MATKKMSTASIAEPSSLASLQDSLEEPQLHGAGQNRQDDARAGLTQGKKRA
jgi:hypothetical protein